MNVIRGQHWKQFAARALCNKRTEQSVSYAKAVHENTKRQREREKRSLKKCLKLFFLLFAVCDNLETAQKGLQSLDVGRAKETNDADDDSLWQ